MQPQIEGSLLNLLIDNSTNRFQMSALRNLKEPTEAKNVREKKESTYQKLQVFNLFETKEATQELDEEE